jgi:hypothetical protein
VPIQQMDTGLTGGPLTTSDFFIYNTGAAAPFAIGDTITLSAGTFTTGLNFNTPAPLNGDYVMFLSTFPNPKIASEPGTVPNPPAFPTTEAPQCFWH